MAALPPTCKLKLKVGILAALPPMAAEPPLNAYVNTLKHFRSSSKYNVIPQGNDAKTKLEHIRTSSNLRNDDVKTKLEHIRTSSNLRNDLM